MISPPSQPSRGRGPRQQLAHQRIQSQSLHTLDFHAWARGRSDGPCEPRATPRRTARLASSQMDALIVWLPSGASRECRRVSARPTRRTRPLARHSAATFRAGELLSVSPCETGNGTPATAAKPSQFDMALAAHHTFIWETVQKDFFYH